MASIDGFGQQIKTDKWIHNLLNDMSRIIPFLDNPKVTDIAIGIGGQIIVEGIGMDKKHNPHKCRYFGNRNQS